MPRKPATSAIHDDRYFTPDEVSEKLRISTGTLANWRSSGTGPPYKRLGKHVRYPAGPFHKWLDDLPMRNAG